jgi:hypothetical protein
MKSRIGLEGVGKILVVNRLKTKNSFDTAKGSGISGKIHDFME